MRSYSVSLVKEIHRAKLYAAVSDLGPDLGMLCVKNNISVMEAAVAMGVSRHTVYRWFTGRGSISRHLVSKVQAYYHSLPTPAVTGS